MKRYVIVLSAVFIALLCSSVVFAERIGVPSVTLNQGEIGIDVEYSYFDREIERTAFVTGITLDPTMMRPGDIMTFKDNAIMRTERVYGTISYGIFNEEGDGFLKGAEAFLRLGAAGAEIPNEFYGNRPPRRGTMAHPEEYTEDFVGDMGFAIGGGLKTTVYRQGPLNVGLLWQITHFTSEDDYTYEVVTTRTRFIQSADIEVTENDIALGASYDIDAGGLGKITPYTGIVGSLMTGNIESSLDYSHVTGSVWYDAPALRTDVDISEDEGTGVFVGVNWAITDFARVGVEGNFYGDGNGISLGGGISF